MVGLLLAATSGCSGDDTGSARLSVSVAALASAPNVDHITVLADMSGEPEQSVNLTFDGSSWTGTMTQIPAGNSWVFSGTAYDSSDSPLYAGNSLPVAIVAQQTATVLLELSPVTPPPPFGNHAPHIDSIYISNAHPGPGDNVSLVVGATDPDTGDQAALVYAWTGDAGSTFTAPAAASTGWSASADGHYGLTIDVTDPHAAYDAVTFAIDVAASNDEGAADISVVFNEAPQITDIVASTGHLQPGVAVAVTAHSVDDDPSGLTYTWSDDCAGSFSPDPTVPNTSNQTQYTPGSTGAASCTVTVTAIDAHGLQNYGSLTIEVGADPQPFGFSPRADFSTGNAPHSVAATDLNGDGRPDLVTANQGTGTVSVLLNATAPGSSTAAFTLAATLTIGGSGYVVAVRDLDGDGYPDIAAVNLNGVYVWTNSGGLAPTFALRSSLAPATSTYSIAIGDVDGDGRPDLVVANEALNTISVFLNTGTTDPAAALFTSAVQFATGASPFSVALGDFDGDGRLDIVAASIGTHSFSILMNQTAAPGTPAFATHEDYAMPDYSLFAKVGDIDGDGRVDLVLTQPNQNAVAVFLDTSPFATGDTATYYSVPTESTPYTVALGDFDNDGHTDLAVANTASSSVTIALNKIAGTEVNFSTLTIPVGTAPVATAVADFNADGRADLAVTENNANAVSVLLDHGP